MERLIAKLVQNFENGAIDRRKLIQSLALAFSAASAGGSASAAPSTSGRFKAASVHHIAYTVPDYAKVRDFYADVFGMPVLYDSGKNCHLRVGDTYLEPGDADLGGRKDMPRIDHIALGIENYDHARVEAELKRRGIPIEHDTAGDVMIRDPAGFPVQIFPKRHLPP